MSWRRRPCIVFLALLALFPAATTSFTVASTTSRTPITTGLHSTFAADGSEYKSDQSDYEDDDDSAVENWNTANSNNYRDDWEEDDTPTIELQPTPLSKNAGNRFLAVVWDKHLVPGEEKDGLDRHYDRIALTEDHVMFCRKTNLYNETFNQNSMVDIRSSYQILSSDLQRVIGHILCLESTKLEYVQETLSNDPIVQMLTGGDISDIPLYRWRHIRDFALRIDDGRAGYPCLCWAVDADPEEVGNLRSDLQNEYLETLIRSERVIAAGPLHLPTEFKNDPSSIPVGDFLFFNAINREEAIAFVENLPTSKAGLYKSLRVHFYNTLDVTGKFVSEDPLRDAPGADMKEALEYWGYPVEDDQTPWLNW